jgi:hypothetical protein
MKDLWYEAVLAPFASSASAEIVQDIKKEFTSLRLDEEKEVEDIKAMRGILRVQQPRWQNMRVPRVRILLPRDVQRCSRPQQPDNHSLPFTICSLPTSLMVNNGR